VKVKGGKSYSWGAIARTRYKISGPLTMTRSYGLGTAPLYGKLEDRCEGLPPRIVTDKLRRYKHAFNKYFYDTGVKLVHGVPIACREHRLKHGNNPIERQNQRIKTDENHEGIQEPQSLQTLPRHAGYHAQLHQAKHGVERRPPSRRGKHQTPPLRRNRILSLIQISAIAF